MPPSRSVHSTATSFGGVSSPAGSMATTRASVDFPNRPEVLVTRADLRSSVAAYEQLLTTGKAFTNAMLVLSRAAGDLASSFESCSKTKGAHLEAETLQACAGLHFLTSNWAQVLADSFWKDFQIPLLSAFDTYRTTCNERQMLHEKDLADKSRALKEIEARNIRNGLGRRGPGRDLASFKLLLGQMQQKVTEIDSAKADYYREVLNGEEEIWGLIQSKVSLMTRSQVEMWERLSSKANSDPVLEHVLGTIPDPFDSYGAPPTEDQILSILPPSSLLSSHGSQSRAVSSATASSSAAAAAALATRDDSSRRRAGQVASTASRVTESKSPRLREDALFEPSDSEDSKAEDDYAILTKPSRPPPSISVEPVLVSSIKKGKAPAAEPQSYASSSTPPKDDKRLSSIREEANVPLSDGEEDTSVGKSPGSPSVAATTSDTHHAEGNTSASVDVGGRSHQDACPRASPQPGGDTADSDAHSEGGSTVRDDVSDDAASDRTVGTLPDPGP